MKVFLKICLVISSVSAGIAQTNFAQDILIPNQSTKNEASQVFGQAFKVLPRGFYEFEDNILGLRGGGAYFSFTTGSHSYNKIPEIGLGRDSISVGFAGFNYGFITDLGKTSIDDISLDSPELVFLASYTPPHKAAEIRAEQRKSSGFTVDGISYSRSLPFKVGHSYALRAISFEEADTLVALTIVSKNDDGSVEIIWRKLKTFDKTKPWYFTDDEISKKLAEILVNDKYSGIDASVKDNVITLIGRGDYRTAYDLRVEIHPLRAVKIRDEIVVIQLPRN